jgi:YfiR/HmsC-like
LILVGGLLAVATTIEGQSPGEYAVKAAFLLNFARFTDWPASAFDNDTAPLILCIVGKDPFGSALKGLDGKSAKGHPIQIDRKANPETLRTCHVAFISDSERSTLNRLLTATEKSSVLTVSDIERFARRGGVIGLLLEGGRIRFEVNLKAADRAQLRLSSNLLKLASIVTE